MKLYIEVSSIEEVVVNRLVKFQKVSPMFWQKRVYAPETDLWLYPKEDAIKHEYMVHKIKSLANREDMHCWLSGSTFNAVSVKDTDAYHKRREKGLIMHKKQMLRHQQKKEQQTRELLESVGLCST